MCISQGLQQSLGIACNMQHVTPACLHPFALGMLATEPRIQQTSNKHQARLPGRRTVEMKRDSGYTLLDAEKGALRSSP
jgi:hypothetical protein